MQSPSSIHKKVAHCARLKTQLTSYRDLHLFRWTFGFLEMAFWLLENFANLLSFLCKIERQKEHQNVVPKLHYDIFGAPNVFVEMKVS